MAGGSRKSSGRGRKGGGTKHPSDNDEFEDVLRAAQAENRKRQRLLPAICSLQGLGIVVVVIAWVVTPARYKLKWGDHHAKNQVVPPATATTHEDSMMMVPSEELDPLDPTTQFLTTFVCEDKTSPKGARPAFCHEALEPIPSRRTQRAVRDIRSGEVVMVIPRHLQVWDLDAVRDPFVRTHLLHARHMDTGNPLDSGAFLATHLIRRLKRATDTWTTQHNDSSETSTLEQDKDPLLPYLKAFPTPDQLEEYHPLLWEDKVVSELLGHLTTGQIIVKAMRDMMKSEYDALCAASPSEFAVHVTMFEFIAMRINVVSRNFATGIPEESILSRDEATELLDVAGLNMTGGCRAMCPILDMYQHHPNPNVEWRYVPAFKAFVVTAAKNGGISAGHEIMDSYGRYTDSRLFAVYGFVNGDGSGWTEANFAVLHQILKPDIKFQFSYLPDRYLSENYTTNDTTGLGSKGPISDEAENAVIKRQGHDLVRYIGFDDGYNECIIPSLNNSKDEYVNTSWILKQLKFRHLVQIANDAFRWTLLVRPRTPDSASSMTSDIPIIEEPPMFQADNFKVDASMVVSTCRLLSLTEDDFDGNAVQVLQDVLTNGTAREFLVDKQSEALEHRALSCLARLATGGLSRYPIQDVELLRQSIPTLKFNTPQWHAAHVQFGEVLTLDIFRHICVMGLRTTRENAMRKAIEEGKTAESVEESLVTRKSPCPSKYLTPLYKRRNTS